MDPSISKEEWIKLQGELDYAPSKNTRIGDWELGGTAHMLIFTCLLDLYAPPESGLILAKKTTQNLVRGVAQLRT